MSQSIILFDGVCNFCNGTVNYILKHDRSNSLMFASLQSDEAKELLKPFGESNEELYSIMLIHKGKLYKKSSAALMIGRIMGGWLRPLAYFCYIFPPFFRNFIYNWIAKNRYKWFGKREACRLPSPEERARFVGN